MLDGSLRNRFILNSKKSRFSPLYIAKKQVPIQKKPLVIHIRNKKPRKQILEKTRSCSSIVGKKLPGEETSRKFWDNVKNFIAAEGNTQFADEDKVPDPETPALPILRGETHMKKRLGSVSIIIDPSQILDYSKEWRRQKTNINSKSRSNASILPNSFDRSASVEDSADLFSISKIDESSAVLDRSNNCSAPSKLAESSIIDNSPESQPELDSSYCLQTMPVINLQREMPAITVIKEQSIEQSIKDSSLNESQGKLTQSPLYHEDESHLLNSEILANNTDPRNLRIQESLKEFERIESFSIPAFDSLDLENFAIQENLSMTKEDQSIIDITEMLEAGKKPSILELDALDRKVVLSKEFKEGLAKNLIYSQPIFNKIALKEWTESQDATPIQYDRRKLPLRGTIQIRHRANRHHNCKRAASQSVFKLHKEEPSVSHPTDMSSWTPFFPKLSAKTQVMKVVQSLKFKGKY